MCESIESSNHDVTSNHDGALNHATYCRTEDCPPALVVNDTDSDDEDHCDAFQDVVTIQQLCANVVGHGRKLFVEDEAEVAESGYAMTSGSCLSKMCPGRVEETTEYTSHVTPSTTKTDT